jgi:nitroreductase
MEVTEAIRRRHMVRSFSVAPLDRDQVDRLVGDALRGPSAGNTRGVAWLVLEGTDAATYWHHATTADWRARARRYPGLSRAPVVALCLCSPPAYVERYGEEDKRRSGLGAPPNGNGEDAWPIPYWFGDAACSTMLLLLGATAAGIGAAFLGNFRGERPLLEALGVPAAWRLYGAVLLGKPDGADHPSPSLRRAVAAGSNSVHRSRW